MRLNGIKPADGAKKDRKRVGRGASAGQGKTGGRGMKGQKSRSGGYHKVGFEGGQMPLQRRLPKIGFKSRKGLVTDEVRLDELAKVEGDTVDLAALKGAGVVRQSVQYVKVFASGELNRKLDVRGLKVTKGARAAIEKAGGTVEE